MSFITTCLQHGIIIKIMIRPMLSSSSISRDTHVSEIELIGSRGQKQMKIVRSNTFNLI